MKTFQTLIVFLMLTTTALCADVTLTWTAQPGMTGYRVYQSVPVNLGSCVVQRWDVGTDVGNVLTYSVTGLQGHTQFKIGAYTDPKTVVKWSKVVEYNPGYMSSFDLGIGE